jgi:signal transduction histidine kinase/CheY-like chemotaxis protein
MHSVMVAVACAAAGAGLRAILDPFLGGTQIWLTFWPASFAAAWFGGLRGATVAVVLSTVLVWLWEVPGSLLTFERAAIGTVVFVLLGVGFGIVADVVRRARLDEKRLREAADTARLEAQEANRAKDEFLAVLGHELRNPLAPIATASALLRRRVPEAGELAVIDRQVKHLSRLVDDLLDVSRIVRGGVELQRGVCELAAVVEKSAEVVMPAREASGHKLEIDVPLGIRIDVDAPRVMQVLTNVLMNAIKYTPPASPIVIRARRDGGRAVLTISDRGPGMDTALLAHAFEPFVQGAQASDRAAGGLGLGLAIARRLTELHGGTLSATSKVGEGTTIELALPTTDAPVEELPVAETLEPAAQRILIVDDNEDAAEMLGALLDSRGHVTRTAFDGPSALGLLDGFSPTLALVDIGLPGMDGHEVARQMRARGIKAPLVALTGYGQESDRVRALAAGFDEHLVKPVSLARIDALIEKLAVP